MNNKLYKRAYKFLELRSKGNNPFKAIDNLLKEESEKVIKFLSYNHGVKFV